MHWESTSNWIKKNWPIYERRLLGLTYEEISKEIGVTRQRVQQICSGMEGYEKALGRRRMHKLAYDEGEDGETTS